MTSRETYDSEGSSSETHGRPSPESGEQDNNADVLTESAQKDRNDKHGLLSKLKRQWDKLGLDRPTLMMMAKGGIPPTIALSIYQAAPVARTYTTLGYLIGIVSILGFAIMPRAKFVQTMVLNLVTICLGTAVALLAIFCAVEARKHTTPALRPGQTAASVPGSTTANYSSSASAVAAIWLFFEIYFVNSMKAKFPQFVFPTILYCIFAVISTTYAPTFANMAQGRAFARQLLVTFLTGFAISTGVSFVIFPVTSRKVVFKEMTGYISCLRGALKAQGSYFHSLEDPAVFATAITRIMTGKDGKKSKQQESAAIKAALDSLAELHGKLHGDLPFAKREVALGKLGPDSLQEMSKLLKSIMLPIVGLGSVIDIFERLAERNEWIQAAPADDSEVVEDAVRTKTIQDWTEIFRTVHDPFASILQVMDEGLLHGLLTLQLVKPPKPNAKGSGSASAAGDDVEAKAEAAKPGEQGFAVYMERKSEEFWHSKKSSLRAWCERKGIELAPDFFDHPATAYYKDVNQGDHALHQRNQRQLYLLLFMEFLLHSASKAVLCFVHFADSQVASGKMSKSRFIVPGIKRLKKWVRNAFKQEDSGNSEDHHVMGDIDSTNTDVYLGQAFKTRKDPEHLPPVNAFEGFGDRIRAVPRLLRSPESAFGFRVACATMSIGIMAFLRQTQTFFIRQRLVWAMIMVTLSMNPTAGQSLFSFTLRIIGTVFAMCASFLIYYIPGEKTPGILVFLWLFVSCGLYIPIKKPRLTIVGMISIVTATLIVGYELEVRKVGATVATSNGQPYYPIYLLAPYRLATVCGGLAVAFIWTIIPYPISEHSQLRKTLGASLYLLANYYSIVHETVRARLRGEEEDMTLKTSPARRLEKARNTVYSKQTLMLNGLRTYSSFLKWEVPIGGRFPKEQYDTIINCVQNVVNYISLVGYASNTFVHARIEGETAWFNDFRKLASTANVTSQEITSLLALLSASVASGQPLPPYLKPPTPYLFSAKLEALDKDILSVRHIAEPGYAAFAVIQISTRCIIGDLEKLLKNVKALVGELDFSFHTVSTSAASSTSNETLWTTGEEKDKHD